MSHSRPIVLYVVVAAVLSAVLFVLTAPLFATWRLEDFAVTFYRAGQYLWHGENVYTSNYPQPDTGLQYPPYAPIWILFPFVPFAALSLPLAEFLRLLMDIAVLPFLAYLCVRWAKLVNIGLVLVVVAAPWLLTEISTGQITPVVFVGALLCYWGLRRSSASIVAVGLWLALSKFTIVSLVIFASLMIAWRRGILKPTLAILGGLMIASSFESPTWILDVGRLYLARLSAPRLSDSVLLLPWYPWSQIALLGVGVVFVFVYLARSRTSQPTPWFWAAIVCLGLVGAPHTFVYDWQLLMLPIAFLLRDRRSVVFVAILYAYSFIWALFLVADWVRLPSPAIIPSIVLIAVLGYPLYLKAGMNSPLVAVESQIGIVRRKG